MKQGKSAQIKSFKKQKAQQKFSEKKKLKPFDYDEFAGFLRARYYLTHQDKYSQPVFEAASFFLDDVITTMVQQYFSKFTSNERAIVNINEVMQAALVNSSDRDWRYFILLMPVLYDMQKFLAREGSVNDRYGIASSNYDPNFWKMIMRTVMALNYFRFQGKDVADLMKNSSAIDDLQFRFLKEEGDDDEFNLEIIEEVYRGIHPKLAELKDADAKPADEFLSEKEIQDEMDYAAKRVEQFRDASIKGVVSPNVVNLLLALHKGMAEKWHLGHENWQAADIKAFVSESLFEYWQPEWENLDGIGSEIKAYIQFLGKKKAILQSKKIVDGLDGLDHYVDVSAINHLLADMPLDQLQENE
ncbi:metaphase chromosome protein 1 [Eupransor demetentiae]|uniref:Metaphase chromosome protein 1 n=1 Tax=Eupransor demetentiae TaxID=3109584 RepID=A0ABM9N617_9LACO|nr:hypothetical protein R54876_GBNLAHCA_01238 [Lactobacillaceae bacterium LMG 33000]